MTVPAAGWLLAAAALLLWPTARAERVDHRSGGPRPGAVQRPERSHPRREVGAAQPVVVVLGVASTCIAVLGVRFGAVAAAVLAPIGLAALTRLRARPATAEADPSLPVVLDLVAAALHGGQPVGAALRLAAPAARPHTARGLLRVATLLDLGAEPAQAWSDAGEIGTALAAVVPVAIRSQSSGIRLADAFERLAAELRAQRVAAAGARAGRAGVHAMAPLAACFLPSFVCLGIVPVVVGVARTVLNSVG